MLKEYFIGDFLKRIKRPISLDRNLEYKLVTIKMNHNGVVLREKKRGDLIKSGMYLVKEGDFILSGIDARNGAFGIVTKELDNAIVTNDFWYFEIDENIISKQLFLELTSTSWFDEICKRGSDGTTQRIRLQKDKFFSQKVLLPVRSEQDNLLKKILFFKEKQSELKKSLETRKQLVIQLKQSILNEAAQGELTKTWRKENPNIELASELLVRIEKEKAQLINNKKINKEFLSIKYNDVLIDLPETWVSSKLDDLVIFTNGKAHEQFIDNNGEFILVNSKFVSTNGLIKKHTNSLLTPLHKDDIAIVMSDVPDGRALSRCYLVEENNLYTLNQRIGSLTPFTGVNSKYLKIVLDRNPYYLNFNDSKKQTNLKKEQILSCPIPLPPLKEQIVIVQKVENLTLKCQNIENEILKSEKNANLLMQIVLKEAFEDKKEDIIN